MSKKPTAIKYRFHRPADWEKFWEDVDSSFVRFVDPMELTSPTYSVDMLRTDHMYCDQDHIFHFYVTEEGVVFKDDFNFNGVMWLLLELDKVAFRKILKNSNKIKT